MSFLNPVGLLGLLSLPVILILHLLRRRQRRYVVSHLGLWSFLDNEARGPRRRKLPITPILLLDLLIAALLSLAWSQPHVALDLPVNRVRHMVILIDVSTSMGARDTIQQSRLEQAKAEAAALLEDTSQRDVVTVVRFGRQARVIADSRLDGALVEEKLREIEAGETGSALREALALGQAALDETLPAEFHVVTDGSFSNEPLEVVQAFPYPLQWHLVGGSADNQAVIELNATPISPGSYQVFARLANFSSQSVTREAVLSVDGRPVSRAVVNLPPGSTVPQVWQVPVGEAASLAGIDVTLSGTDILREDDNAAIGLQSGGQTRVALVGDDPSVLQQAAQIVPGVELIPFTSADYSASAAAQTLPAFDLTIFHGYQPPAWPGGHVLVVEPPSAGQTPDAPETITFFSQSSSEITPGSAVRIPNPNPLVEGIDFSGVRWSRAWNLSSIPAGFVSLLQAEDVPILLQGEIRAAPNERSRVIVLLADLTQGNFTRHPAFPILIANLVEQSRQAPLPPAFQTGDTLPLPVTGSYETIEITPPGQPPVAMDQDWPAEWTDTQSPGLYRFRYIEADGDVSEFATGARAGDAEESDLRARAWVENEAAAANASENSDRENQQIDLRPWLLGAAILVLLLEAILAWRS